MTSSAVTVAEQAFVWNCIYVSVGTLAIYEHVLTIAEVRMLWTRRRNAVSILLILNRYVTLVYACNSMVSAIPSLSRELLCLNSGQ
ncbi:hypothetical protein BC835DRAFT_888559 [Cytidiella melzeri]|nr:hypothetical protein BC835DRAFT_888559 [Cytidiella melzeri]